MEGFAEITEKYRQKHYPNGYFAWMAKHSGGIGLIICGIVLAAMGGLIGAAAVNLFGAIISGELTAEGNTTPAIIILIVALVFLVPGILLIVFGVKRKTAGRAGWMQKCMDRSGYTENVLQDFESQMSRTDAMIFRTDPSEPVSILTTDYIMWGNLMNPCLMKISDIVGAYLASRSYTYYVQNRARTGHTLNLALFSNHKTQILLTVKKDRAEHLVSLLKAKNPDIETADGAVLTEEEYNDMADKLGKI